MKPQDYKALQIFVQHVDERFKGMEDSIKQWLGVIKKNRDEIDKLHGDVAEIVDILAEFKNGIEEGREEREKLSGLIKDLRDDMKNFESNIEAMNDISQALENGSSTPLTEAVGKVVNPVAQAPPTPPPIPAKQVQTLPHTPTKQVQTPPPAPPKQVQSPTDDDNDDDDPTQPTPPPDTKHKIYTEDELRKMDWHLLKKLGGSLGCKKINGGRDFYTTFIINQQNTRKKGGN